jgi:hypothetical protein
MRKSVIAKRPAVKESEIERRLFERVEALGGICVKCTVLGRRGFPDRIVILPGGRVHFVELKKPRGSRMSIHQQWYRHLFEALGVDYLIVKTEADIARLLSHV